MTVQANQLLRNTSQGTFGKGDLIEGLTDAEVSTFTRKGWVTVVALDGAQMPATGSGDAAPVSTADDAAEPADDEAELSCPHCEKTYSTEHWLNKHVADKHFAQTANVKPTTESEKVKNNA